MRPKLLILGGTSEAAALACRIDREIGPVVELVTSLAGRMASLPDLPGSLRVGGFGGPDGLAAYLEAESIWAVIDATHPFADTISAHAAQACRKTGVPLSVLERAPWPREAGDQWMTAASMQEAAEQIPKLGRRAFLTIGKLELDVFRPVRGVWFLVRLIDRPEAPLPPDWELVLGRPPFGEEDEIRLMRQHRIELLVAKASGGAATYGKIAAARTLGIPVLMVERPQAAGGKKHASVETALDWIKETLFSPP